MERRAGIDRLSVMAVVITVVVVAVFASVMLRGRSLEVQYDLYLFHNGPPAVILAWLGLLVLRRQPGNGAGQILVAIAVVSAAHTIVAAFADARFVAAGLHEPMSDLVPVVRPAEMPLDARLPLLAMNVVWVFAPALMITLLPLVFPDGNLPGPRWRWVPAAAAVGVAALAVALGIDAWPTATWTADETPAIVGVLMAAGGLCILVAASGGLVALGIRWHRAAPHRRRSYQVVGATAAILGLVAVATYPWQAVWVPPCCAPCTHCSLPTHSPSPDTDSTRWSRSSAEQQWRPSSRRWSLPCTRRSSSAWAASRANRSTTPCCPWSPSPLWH